MSSEPLLEGYEQNQKVAGENIPNESVADVHRHLRRNRKGAKKFLSMQPTEPELSARKLAEPGAFRRYHLNRIASRKGISHDMRPVGWRIPLLTQIENTALFGLTHYAGEDIEGVTLKEGSSTVVTYFSLLKSMVNTSILFVPRGFMLGGLAFSIIIFVIIASICTTCMLWLAKSRNNLGGSYGELAGAALGPAGYYIVESAILLTQMGFSIVGIVFFNNNFLKISSYLGYEYSLVVPCVVQLCICVPMSLLRKISDHAFAHIIADVIILANLIYICTTDITIISEAGLGPNIEMINYETCLLMFGMSVYSFEGIGLVIPIQSAMKDETKFPKVLLLLMITVTTFVAAFSTLCYLTFGSNTAQIITMNMEKGPADTGLISVYLVAVLFTFPLMIFPTLQILEGWLYNKIPEFMHDVNRVFVVIFCIVCAFFLNEKADKYISILGALLCSPLSYILPSIIHLRINKPPFFERVLAFIFIVVGIIAGITTFVLAIMNWNE